MRFDRAARGVVAAGLGVCLAGAAACGGDDGNPVQPGRTWALTVSVTSEQRLPVRNATVRVVDGPDAARTAVTDEAGNATFSSLQEGSFSIEVTAQDYYPATTSVSLTTSRSVTVTMKERNRPPVITSLASRGGLDKQPSGLADVGQALEIVAAVTDVETSAANLAFEWTADTGTLSGTGATVRWQAPSAGPWPRTATIGLTVTERYTEPGSSVVKENKTSGELEIQVHDFVAENAALGLRFLGDFSQSSIPADAVIANSFTTSARCAAGRTSELGDVADNRRDYEIKSSRLGPATVAIHFASTSPFRARPGDAWVDMPCGWTSVRKADGTTEVVDGLCRMTSVIDAGRWGLCWSDFQPGASSVGTRFIR